MQECVCKKEKAILHSDFTFGGSFTLSHLSSSSIISNQLATLISDLLKTGLPCKKLLVHNIALELLTTPSPMTNYPSKWETICSITARSAKLLLQVILLCTGFMLRNKFLHTLFVKTRWLGIKCV